MALGEEVKPISKASNMEQMIEAVDQNEIRLSQRLTVVEQNVSGLDGATAKLQTNMDSFRQSVTNLETLIEAARARLSALTKEGGFADNKNWK